MASGTEDIRAWRLELFAKGMRIAFKPETPVWQRNIIAEEMAKADKAVLAAARRRRQAG